MSSNNPSALQQARKAQADEVMALRNKCTGLEETVETLQEDVEKVLRDNRTLRSETNKVLTAYNDLCSRFDKSQKELHSLQEFQTRATKLLMALSSGQNVDKIRSDILAAALASRDPGAHLRALVDDDQGSNREDQEDDQPDGAEPRSHQVITGAEQAGAQGIQEELRDSAVMLNVVAKALCQLHGATTRLKPEQMHYPHGLIPQDVEWPSTGEGDARVPYLRFDWTKKHDDAINIQEFNRWWQYVRSRGPELVPDARNILDQAVDSTIQARCIIKYAYEADKYRKYLKEQNANPDNEDNAAVGEPGASTNPPSKKKTLAYIRSRADAKIKVRQRKLETIEADKYSDVERRTFLTHGAQSADEEEWITGEDGRSQKTPNVYVTRAWSFLSQRFKDMKADVDSRVDPDPPRAYATRIPGPPREGPPPNNLCNQYLLREWMVDPAVLTANPEWKRTRRVIPDNEPVESEAHSRKRKRSGPGSTHVQGTTVEVDRVRQDYHRAKTTHNTDLGGKSLEQLRDDLTNNLDVAHSGVDDEEGDGGLDTGDGDDWT